MSTTKPTEMSVLVGRCPFCEDHSADHEVLMRPDQVSVRCTVCEQVCMEVRAMPDTPRVWFVRVGFKTEPVPML